MRTLPPAWLVLIASLLLHGCASAYRGLPTDALPDDYAAATWIDDPEDQPQLLWREDPVHLRAVHLVDSGVAVDICVNEKGEVGWTRFVAGDPKFFASVRRAARRWKFEPLVVDGGARRFILPVDFTLRWTRQPVAAHIDIRLAAAR